MQREQTRDAGDNAIVAEARWIISVAARELSVSEDDVVVHIGLTDTRPSKGQAN
jgi:hypothetical protein